MLPGDLRLVLANYELPPADMFLAGCLLSVRSLYESSGFERFRVEVKTWHHAACLVRVARTSTSLRQAFKSAERKARQFVARDIRPLSVKQTVRIQAWRQDPEKLPIFELNPFLLEIIRSGYKATRVGKLPNEAAWRWMELPDPDVQTWELPLRSFKRARRQFVCAARALLLREMCFLLAQTHHAHVYKRSVLLLRPSSSVSSSSEEEARGKAQALLELKRLDDQERRDFFTRVFSFCERRSAFPSAAGTTTIP